MSITLGNPIQITSGTLNTTILTQNTKIRRILWSQPTLESTSGLIISKKDAAGNIYLEARCEASGESQFFNIPGWYRDPYCRCVPTGTLSIYLE